MRKKRMIFDPWVLGVVVCSVALILFSFFIRLPTIPPIPINYFLKKLLLTVSHNFLKDTTSNCSFSQADRPKKEHDFQRYSIYNDRKHRNEEVKITQTINSLIIKNIAYKSQNGFSNLFSWSQES